MSACLSMLCVITSLLLGYTCCIFAKETISEWKARVGLLTISSHDGLRSCNGMQMGECGREWRMRKAWSRVACFTRREHKHKLTRGRDAVSPFPESFTGMPRPPDLPGCVQGAFRPQINWRRNFKCSQSIYVGFSTMSARCEDAVFSLLTGLFLHSFIYHLFLSWRTRTFQNFREGPAKGLEQT